MARITTEERERKKAQYDALILSIFLEEGWDAITYDRLAKDLGIGKSSVQRYYENRMLFATALQGKLMPMALRRLDMTSKEAFIDSWELAINDDQDHVFREIVRMLMTNILHVGTSKATAMAVNRLISVLSTSIGENEAVEAVKASLGLTMFVYMNQ
ncbi:TetR/AcrR family transcriptional regulator [Aliivibrio sp. S3MY1]|uniref:TetR/AcrR family transcriptional regulator n=1 Tax=unclassified Aliivibrio TaxID=2645654 RepID=UPI002377DFB0|nr:MULTISPECIES: TetR/AcrR family transcriptional regulator [unclassified Aliivibrio]MDD9194460.1 TetR/AcrR family transcriptional regulator [Aliivibrio sp. S3MY1]MDD9198201.1 TetR/AcrR family transcriptional regulator [Aliivibrio sp. S2MY1]